MLKQINDMEWRFAQRQNRRHDIEIYARIVCIIMSVFAAMAVAYRIKHAFDYTTDIKMVIAILCTAVVATFIHTVVYRIIVWHETSIIERCIHSWRDQNGEFLYLFDRVTINGNYARITGRNHDGMPTVTIAGMDYGTAVPPAQLVFDGDE